MHVVMFYHSLLGCWNHGNAHFLRGVASELAARGHQITIYEPKGAWSLENQLAERDGAEAIREFRETYAGLDSRSYTLDGLDLDAALGDADLVLVHEWNDHALVERIGRHRAASGNRYRLLFHDTHHRSLTDRGSIAAYDLTHYDGVLAFGEVIRELYLAKGWAARAFTWHEAADTRVFKPIEGRQKEGDLVFIGNWGDDERSAELDEFLFQSAAGLALRTRIHGVRYPQVAIERLDALGIHYAGWLPNLRVPEVYARHRVTVHVPRRPYVQALPGIPTIRPFEALACGIPLVSAPWEDIEGLFEPGSDYLVARNGQEMRRHLRALLDDPDMAAEMALHGHQTILRKHTCAHRVNELLAIVRELNSSQPRGESASCASV